MSDHTWTWAGSVYDSHRAAIDDGVREWMESHAYDVEDSVTIARQIVLMHWLGDYAGMAEVEPAVQRYLEKTTQ